MTRRIPAAAPAVRAREIMTAVAPAEAAPGAGGHDRTGIAAPVVARAVGRIMTRSVCTLSPDMPLSQAMSLLVDRGLAAMPVVEDGNLVGILTESDLMRVLGRGDAQGHPRLLALVRRPELLSSFELRGEGARVRSVMTARVATVTETTTIGDAAALMAGHGVKRLPVLAADSDRLVGIVSRADILRALASGAAAAPASSAPKSDRALQRDAERAIGPSTANEWAVVSVRRGVARLEGALGSDARRLAVIRDVAAVPGIGGVDDRLVVHAITPW